MKRAIGLIFLTIACIAAFLSVRGTLPFMPIFGSSMEPTLQSGGLLMIDPVEPQDVKVGDIIVYNVPSMVRDYYNYPPTVAHRVTEINTVPSLGFRTAGDNTGEDPFTVRPQDLRGTVGNQIPFLGLPLLFFQSQQGLIFVIIALILLAIFLYGGELSRGGNLVHRGIFAPVINEEKRSNRVLTRKMEATEQKMTNTEQALGKFAAAVAEYAQHLSSHTSAIQGLAEASHELKRSAAEQNRVLMNLVKNTEEQGPGKETLAQAKKADIAPPEKPAPATEKLVSGVEKPVAKKILPFHWAIQKPEPEKPIFKIEKPLSEVKKPAEPKILLSHRALHRPEPEKSAPKIEKPLSEVKKPAEVKIIPSHLALYRPYPEKSRPKVEKIVPVAEKLVISTRKSVIKAKKPDEIEEPASQREPGKSYPPGCARQRHPLAPF